MGQKCAVILAAGDGKRMRSQRSKVLCEVLFRPMLEWVLDNCTGAGLNRICVVVGKSSEDVCRILPEGTATAVQQQRLGTGHAVLCAREFLHQNLENDVLIVSGDAPFLFAPVIEAAYEAHRAAGNAMTVISAKVDDPYGYGRIVRDGAGVAAIVEEKDADDDVRELHEINSGAIWFQARELLPVLDQLTPANAQGELYLTDTLKLLRSAGRRVDAFDAGDRRIVLGANTRRDLAALNDIAREMVFDRLYEAGVDIPVTDGVVVSAEAQIGPDTRILPGTVIKGRAQIGRGCVVGPNSWVEDAVLGDGCVVKASYVTRSELRAGAEIGPFSQIRPDCVIGEGVKIGDFVEVKNSVVGAGTKMAHLTYVGDTDCGERVNFGCGTVTVNHNGREKCRTTIGDDCFIGCNTNLIAPVTIGDGAYTAAGSTVTKDVPAGALCIARAREVVKENRAADFLKKKPE